MESKKEIRKKILAYRDALTEKERTKAEILLTERILGHQWYYGASEILSYAAHGSEISAAAIMEDAFRCGKKVYIPRVEGFSMEFYRIFPGEKLTAGYKGILEPSDIEKRERFHYTKESVRTTLMLIPGVAFDALRSRIGYGLGFYDRYLSDKEELRTIAIGFACQMVRYIDAEETDIRPMQVICM